MNEYINQHSIQFFGHLFPVRYCFHCLTDVHLQWHIYINIFVLISVKEVTSFSVFTLIFFWQIFCISRCEEKIETIVFCKPSARVYRFIYIINIKIFVYLLFSRWTNIDFASYTTRLKLIGDCHIVAKKAVSWHLTANNTS